MKHIYEISFRKEHLTIHDGDSTILVDTGSPTTIHHSGILRFAGKDHTVMNSLMGTDVRDLSQLAEIDFTTLMGLDILSEYKVILDYSGGTMTLYEDEKPQFDGTDIILERANGVLLVPAGVLGHRLTLALDTGATLSYIDPDVVRGIQPAGMQSDFHPMAGRFETPVYHADTTIGGRRFMTRYGVLPSFMASVLRITGIDGVVGYDFFSAFKVYLDCMNGILKIQ